MGAISVENREETALLLMFPFMVFSALIAVNQQTAFSTIFSDSAMPPDIDNLDIGQTCRKQLCDLLERLAGQGVSQQQVALRAGLPPQYLSDIKNGRRPMTELVARRIGHEFHVNYEWLLGMSDSLEPVVLRTNSQNSSSTGNWLPVFPDPISGNPQDQSKWDGTSLQVTGAPAAKLVRLRWPYVLRFGADDHRDRIQRGDLILVSQSDSDDAEIHVVECRRKLVLARKKLDGSWERLAKGERLPKDIPVAGHCVGVIWSSLVG